MKKTWLVRKKTDRKTLQQHAAFSHTLVLVYLEKVHNYSCNMHGVTAWKKPKMKKTWKSLIRFSPWTVTNSLFPLNPNTEQQKQGNVPWSNKHPPNMHLVVSPSSNLWQKNTGKSAPGIPRCFFSVRLVVVFFHTRSKSMLHLGSGTWQGGKWNGGRFRVVKC